MKSFSFLAILVITTIVASVASAAYPMLDKVAAKVVQKYQTATCQQLMQEKAESQGKPKSETEQHAIQMLREDAGMRAEFFSKVSVPVVTKMFECGMIP